MWWQPCYGQMVCQLDHERVSGTHYRCVLAYDRSPFALRLEPYGLNRPTLFACPAVHNYVATNHTGRARMKGDDGDRHSEEAPI